MSQHELPPGAKEAQEIDLADGQLRWSLKTARALALSLEAALGTARALPHLDAMVRELCGVVEGTMGACRTMLDDVTVRQEALVRLNAQLVADIETTRAKALAARDELGGLTIVEAKMQRLMSATEDATDKVVEIVAGRDRAAAIAKDLEVMLSNIRRALVDPATEARRRRVLEDGRKRTQEALQALSDLGPRPDGPPRAAIEPTEPPRPVTLDSER